MQNEWIESSLGRGHLEREKHWSEAVPVGRRSFVEEVKDKLGARARYRRVDDVDGLSILHDGEEPIGPVSGMRLQRPFGTPRKDLLTCLQ